MTTPTGNIPTKVRKLNEDFQAMFDTVYKIEKTQQTHGQKLNKLQSDVSGIQTDMSEFRTDVMNTLGVIISRLPER